MYQRIADHQYRFARWYVSKIDDLKDKNDPYLEAVRTRALEAQWRAALISAIARQFLGIE